MKSYVSNHIGLGSLAEVMHSTSQFGDFNFCWEEEGMTVVTSKEGTSDRRWKFVKSPDCWEAYEVNESGMKIGEPFAFNV